MSPEAYLVLGVVLGILFTELTDVSPGGLIVPGYLALFRDRPDRIALSLVVAVLTVAVLRLTGRFLILFGRRRFALFLLAGFAIRVLAEFSLPLVNPGFSSLEAVGWLIPGIIASDMDKQGVPKTLLAAGAVAALVILVALAVEYVV
ncbi:MAG: poly-gamma-glutamate biosynthesis protein PgsC [Spirochaetia bacterium]|nr:poly-gamma-glutamate biosynthesis protein PgsC [Spirochaetia bacterium]